MTIELTKEEVFNLWGLLMANRDVCSDTILEKITKLLKDMRCETLTSD